MKKLVLLLALCLVLPGCLYAHIKIPFDTDVDQTTLGSKVGTASNHAVLGLVAWGDAGTQAAAEEGGITTVRHMDQEILIILFIFYHRRTTIVYGD